MSTAPQQETIAVVGLGYVGLPCAVALARCFPVIGFDRDTERVAQLAAGSDRTGEVAASDLSAPWLRFTSDEVELAAASFFIIAVPTPLTADHHPDLGAVEAAARTVGKYLGEGACVVVESTVYPGVTEELVGAILAEVSGLDAGVDFQLGYSPERINPGDREHAFERVVKVVAGSDEAALERVARVYGAAVPAGVFRARSIRVAEASKLLENTQRDLNIALMNELALICDRLGVATRDVLETARTKWNFLPFEPGLVGGHCISIDPYYLTAKAQAVGYHPEVILAGRRINDAVASWVAQRAVKLLAEAEIEIRGARVGVLGLTFKEDFGDLRHSRVAELVAELEAFGCVPVVHDPLCDADEALRRYGIRLASWDDLGALDAIVLAVRHRAFLERPIAELLGGLREGGVVVDVKRALDPAALPEGVTYWAL
ncbi:MAG: nucleotide sugar dehydrogenase [Deltaproteobacteria bacterium]|nr:nucleotide sugar dehydrogenase [Deltaproteobacteria bacterium]